jgi:hypothetical protein
MLSAADDSETIDDDDEWPDNSRRLFLNGRDIICDGDFTIFDSIDELETSPS